MERAMGIIKIDKKEPLYMMFFCALCQGSKND